MIKYSVEQLQKSPYPDYEAMQKEPTEEIKFDPKNDQSYLMPVSLYRDLTALIPVFKEIAVPDLDIPNALRRDMAQRTIR